MQTSPHDRLLAALPVTERRLTLNRVSTMVLEGGDGPPMVLLHGPGAYGAAWLRAIPRIAKTYRIVAPDLPGHGASAAPAGAPDTDLLNGWLDDLIECTCSIPPVLVGHTLGGAVAARFAADRSERLAALVLVDALGLTDFRPSAEFGWALNAFVSTPTAHTHDQLWSRCAFDLPTLQRQMGEQREAMKAYNLECATAPALQAAQGGLMQKFGLPAIPAATLSRIAAPTTLIWGRHGLATQLSIAQEASARCGWRLHVIENAADDPAIEQPEIFIDTLRVVLEQSIPQEVKR